MTKDGPPLASVIVLAGPSGCGKSRLAARLGLPLVQLDDFYKDEDDPTIVHRGGAVDWESPGSWKLPDALDAITTLCLEGEVDVPVYEFSKNRSTGHKVLQLDGAPYVVAEGLFAAQVLPGLRERGLLGAAIVLANPRAVTLVRRVVRDFADRRKPPLTILRLGWQRYRTDPAIVRELTAAGATALTNRDAEAYLSGLIPMSGLE